MPYAASGGDNKSASWATAIVTYKTAGPTIPSIVTADANPTSASTVRFTVTFSQPVLDVDAEDFQLVTSGVSGASIASATTSDNMVYTVTVNTGSGNGTIHLNYFDHPDAPLNANNIPLPAN